MNTFLEAKDFFYHLLNLIYINIWFILIRITLLFFIIINYTFKVIKSGFKFLFLKPLKF